MSPSLDSASARKIVGVLMLCTTIAITVAAAITYQSALHQTFTVPFNRGEEKGDGADAAIAAAASEIRAYPKNDVRVVGFTEPGGDATANIALSARRAEIVKNALEDAGVPGTRLHAFGAGSASPPSRLKSEDDDEFDRRTARVEISLER